MNRRQFMMTSALAAAGTVAGFTSDAHAADRKLIKSLKMGMITSKDKDGKPLSIHDRLKIAKKAGFESVEPDTIFRDKDLAAYAKASEKLDFPIDGIICSTHWGKPLSDPDPEVFEQTMKGMRTSMENAKALGGDMVLLVPAVVNPQVQYKDAWTRAVERTKRLAEDAERLNITIGIENVWNKFLLSPLEAAAFIDEIDSKYVKFWFDIGNVVQFGYPEDWIRTLGDRIARLDVKDFKRGNNSFVPLTKGDVDWKAVMTAIDEIGFEGYAAAEVSGGDLDYLTDMVSKPMDTIFAL
ncbi:MAG: sugar phosphate isomerase/epimerase family protein [Candidatus Hydrogenedentota bacterium]